MAKRLFDLIFSTVGLVCTSPIFAVCAILVKQDSPGPVYYRATRVGRNHKLFTMYKFRTMVTDADKKGGSSTPDDDPRITRVGQSLRRYKLDELPQLINVVKGDMSFVGPRPQVQWAVELYTKEQQRVLDVRPGITDYASVRFPNEGEILRGSASPDKDYMEQIHPEKMRLSLEYISRRSLRVDIGVILQTFSAIWRR